MVGSWEQQEAQGLPQWAIGKICNAEGSARPDATSDNQKFWQYHFSVLPTTSWIEK